MSGRDERGVTLMELLIAITITGIIMIPIGGAIYVGLRTSVSTQNRVQESVGGNLLSTYFGPDVQNSVLVAANVPEAVGVCPSPRTVDLLLTTEAVVSSVSYYRGTGATAGVLYRRVCTAGVAAPPTVLIRYLASGSGAVNVACAPLACDATWRSVTLTVSQLNAPMDAVPFVSTVSAARRVS